MVKTSSNSNPNINIGIIGAGYMGKAHAVAMSSVGAVFATKLRPRLEILCTTSLEGAKTKAAELGFKRYTDNWRDLVADSKIDAIIIASPQDTHLDITSFAAELGKPIFCEKPLGQGLDESKAMVQLVEENNIINMVGFNYIRTPASQLARKIIKNGEIGEITYFRGEHSEDFFHDPNQPTTWRSYGRSNGTMGDLAPHMINASLAIIGPIESLIADIETIHKSRPTVENANPKAKINDDQGQFLCRFANGAMGHLYFSRIATGRKMGYIYEIVGTKGAIRFNQEDQNSLMLYKSDQADNRQGFTKILTGPTHPDYLAFCQGPGHGTGYQDQIIIEARDFLSAIEQNKSIWPKFRDCMEVNQIIEASFISSAEKRWVNINDIK